MVYEIDWLDPIKSEIDWLDPIKNDFSWKG